LRILFFIEDLNSGGKERRLVELIKGLTNYSKIKLGIVLTRNIIHYKDILLSDIEIFYVSRKDGVKKDSRVFYHFYKIAKEFQPDIIHVWGNLVAIYAIPSKVILGIPMINNQITDAPIKVSNSLLSHKLTFPFSNRIISNSYAGLIAYNAPKRNSSVIYNGFDFRRIEQMEEEIKVRKRFNIKTKFVVGMIASFSKRKDYNSYIRAASSILKKNREISFLCIGAGDDSSYQQIVDIENKDRILFLGKQSNVESIMNICDIGVLSTYSEGISNALLEFAALGKPVVTTFGGGNSELVEQGKTGFLVNQNQSGELADKIRILLDDEKKRIEFGIRGKDKVIKQFSIENMVFNFISIYEEILNLKKHG